MRIRIAVPPEGLGNRLDQIIAWLDINCGADGWTSTPSSFAFGETARSSSTRGVVNDALAVHFIDATIASAFVVRWCAAQTVEIVDEVYRVRDDEPTPRIGAGSPQDALNGLRFPGCPTRSKTLKADARTNNRDRGHVLSRIFFVIPALTLLAALPAEAEMFGPDYQPCGDKSSTLAIVECVQAKTKASDQRLNAAYKALQGRIDPAQRQPLLAAQRLWVQYRDANCGFYGAQEGSIRQVQAAECMRSMTEDRARELEKAMKFD